MVGGLVEGISGSLCFSGSLARVRRPLAEALLAERSMETGSKRHRCRQECQPCWAAGLVLGILSGVYLVGRAVDTRLAAGGGSAGGAGQVWWVEVFMAISRSAGAAVR